MNGSVENYNGIQGGKKKTNAQTKAPMMTTMNLDLVFFITNMQASWRWGCGGGGSKDEEKLVGARKQTDILWHHPPSLRGIVVNGPTHNFLFFSRELCFQPSPIQLFLLYDRQASQPAAWVGARPTSVDGQARTSWPNLQTLDEHVYHHPPSPQNPPCPPDPQKTIII